MINKNALKAKFKKYAMIEFKYSNIKFLEKKLYGYII